MNKLIANKRLRRELKQFGDFVSNPIKRKLIYTDRYGNQIKKKIDFITTDINILKEKTLIKSKLKFINILNYYTTDEDKILDSGVS